MERRERHAADDVLPVRENKWGNVLSNVSHSRPPTANRVTGRPPAGSSIFLTKCLRNLLIFVVIFVKMEVWTSLILVKRRGSLHGQIYGLFSSLHRSSGHLEFARRDHLQQSGFCRLGAE
ncbi:Sensory box/ggdef family protein [Geobacillus sp. WSUCF1]|nr:Sensory box/ggdef family protein [Geobacillus sp. WSUCF1]